jgi:hypothetical protein
LQWILGTHSQREKPGLLCWITVGKEVKMIHGCTHNLFKDNFFSDYIERIQRWAAQDLGVVIPDPPRIDIQ